MNSDQPFLSVIIPTYNRRELVRKTLQSLAHQIYPATRFEVILCDDGSTDGTGEMVQSLELSYSLRYSWQANRGRCAARNMGLAHAQGDLIIFLDGDMVAAPELIAEHVASHSSHQKVLVRGDIRLPPEIRNANIFTALGLGPMDDFASHIADENGFLPFSFSHTGNLSMTRSALDEIGPQDEAFDVSYAWDDVDLGYRAQRLGYRLLFNPRALAWHHDYVRTVEQQGKRLQTLSHSVNRLFEKYPELEGTIAMFRDKGDISLETDGPVVLFKKIGWRTLSLGLVHDGLVRTTNFLEWLGHPRPLVAFFHRLILGSDIFLGYQAGLAERRRNRHQVSSSEPTSVSVRG